MRLEIITTSTSSDIDLFRQLLRELLPEDEDLIVILAE